MLVLTLSAASQGQATVERLEKPERANWMRQAQAQKPVHRTPDLWYGAPAVKALEPVQSSNAAPPLRPQAEHLIFLQNDGQLNHYLTWIQQQPALRQARVFIQGLTSHQALQQLRHRYGALSLQPVRGLSVLRYLKIETLPVLLTRTGQAVYLEP